MIRKNAFFKWKYISIYDDSQKEIIRYELDDNERLINKMKRLKKRSFITAKLKKLGINNAQSIGLNNAPLKLEYFNQVVFSFENKELNEKIKIYNAQQEKLKCNNITLPVFTPHTDSSSFTLPSLFNRDQSTINPDFKNVFYITDISEDFSTGK